jgi:AsmA protein
MKSLSGKGGLSMGRGVILGIDLDRLMRSGDASGGTTVFDDLSATYTITAGQVLNEDLQLLLSNFRAEGAGRIGIGPQDMDYTFTPIALRANSGKGLAIPVRITGPWASPRIIPDLGAAFDVDVDGKIEEAKQDARQKVEQKVIEELNVAPQEGQSVEDAVKDKLEDEAKRGLLKLLGQD